MSADAVVEIVAALIELAIEVGGELTTDQAVKFVRELRASNDTLTPSPSATRAVLESPATYAIIGAALGGASLWFWPERVAHSAGARLGLVFITAIVGGSVMAAVGAYRQRRQRPPGRLATFGTGALFALAYAAARAIGHYLG